MPVPGVPVISTFGSCSGQARGRRVPPGITRHAQSRAHATARGLGFRVWVDVSSFACPLRQPTCSPNPSLSLTHKPAHKCTLSWEDRSGHCTCPRWGTNSGLRCCSWSMWRRGTCWRTAMYAYPTSRGTRFLAAQRMPSPGTSDGRASRRGSRPRPTTSSRCKKWSLKRGSRRRLGRSGGACRRGWKRQQRRQVSQP